MTRFLEEFWMIKSFVCKSISLIPKESFTWQIFQHPHTFPCFPLEKLQTRTWNGILFTHPHISSRAWYLICFIGRCQELNWGLSAFKVQHSASGPLSGKSRRNWIPPFFSASVPNFYSPPSEKTFIWAALQCRSSWILVWVWISLGPDLDCI